jgi:hypothetical protein
MTYSQDSVVGIAIHYGLGGLRIESRYRQGFPHPFTQSLWPKKPPVKWVPGFFLGGKAAGAWRWPLTPFSAEVKERMELNLYSPSGPSGPVLEWTLLLHKE